MAHDGKHTNYNYCTAYCTYCTAMLDQMVSNIGPANIVNKFLELVDVGEAFLKASETRKLLLLSILINVSRER